MMVAKAANAYRIPAVLRDLVMVDLLEITGSTTATAELLLVSQPSVSRRYRSLAEDLDLGRQCDAPVGRRYSDAPWVMQLRRGVNHHRLARGCLRVGGAVGCAPLFHNTPWAQWVRIGRAQLDHWPELLKMELLDAVVLPQNTGWTIADPDQVALVELRLRERAPAWLVCRRDPLVLEVVRGITRRLEVS